MKRLLNFSALAFLVGLTIVVAGCGAPAKPENNQSKIKEVNRVSEKQEKTNLFKEVKKKTIQEALKSNTPYKCVIKAGDKGEEKITYIKGDDFRTEAMINGNKMITVKKGGVIYTWDEGNKQGTKIDIKCMEEINKSMNAKMAELNEVIDQFNPQSLRTKVEKENAGISCEPVMGINLSVPKNIEMIDQCEMFKNLPKMPTGNTSPKTKGSVVVPMNIPGN